MGTLCGFCVSVMSLNKQLTGLGLGQCRSSTWKCCHLCVLLLCHRPPSLMWPLAGPSTVAPAPSVAIPLRCCRPLSRLRALPWGLHKPPVSLLPLAPLPVGPRWAAVQRLTPPHFSHLCAAFLQAMRRDRMAKAPPEARAARGTVHSASVCDTSF